MYKCPTHGLHISGSICTFGGRGFIGGGYHYLGAQLLATYFGVFSTAHFAPTALSSNSMLSFKCGLQYHSDHHNITLNIALSLWSSQYHSYHCNITLIMAITLWSSQCHSDHCNITLIIAIPLLIIAIPLLIIAISIWSSQYHSYHCHSYHRGTTLDHHNNTLIIVIPLLIIAISLLSLQYHSSHRGTTLDHRNITLIIAIPLLSQQYCSCHRGKFWPFLALEFDSLILKTQFNSLWGVTNMHISCP